MAEPIIAWIIAGFAAVAVVNLLFVLAVQRLFSALGVV